ncbi:hypothetical protein NBRC10512_001063 [Rhodotorula toruloides]|uniref:RHTO0S06e10572g1_1 n=2 Tax=Rhodotorula toruloides TaxID=5286 RepID=A0A061B575_RHOTO|nr:uncharacterized protein RHTO_04416 [Rhodotorula toruloides NP11]EMS19415.1 hypothetical protein RHTO_04416 [Rhodotorula toruloides NP11]CDR42168.1 RHTO0S06e10572g1_1 [Rhodotorula toruloides]
MQKEPAVNPRRANSFFARKHDLAPAPDATAEGMELAQYQPREVMRGGEGAGQAGQHRAELRLSTTCGTCGDTVAMEVPPWLLAALDGAQRTREMMRQDQLRQQDVVTVEGVAWRDRVVDGAIGFAKAVKASPLPGFIFSCLQTLLAIVFYLDARFSIHQRLAVAFGIFLEGLVEIEKEVGLLRNAGEALSVGWEATVKGIIAFAKAESSQNRRPERSSAPQHVPPPATEPWQASFYAPADDSYTSPPLQPSQFPPHIHESVQFPHIQSASTTRAPSPALSHPRPLRRTHLSSPVLNSAYLSGMSPVLSPTDERPPSLHSSSLSESILPPYDDATAASTSAYPSYGQAVHRVPLTRQRSVSGPDACIPPAPPSPSGSRAGWAGKAMLGLAERMKVL